MFDQPAPLTDLHDGALGLTETPRPNPIRRAPVFTREQALEASAHHFRNSRLPEREKQFQVRQFAGKILAIDPANARRG
jgi:hypothetical protein